MSDLSRLLDDVYGPSDTSVPPAPPAPAPSQTGLPDWALDSVLDDAFSDWMPGSQEPPADGPGAVSTTPVPVTAAGAPPEAAAPVAARAWTRSDDDILPTRRSGRGGRSDAEELVLSGAPAEAVGEEQPVSAKGRFRRRKG